MYFSHTKWKITGKGTRDAVPPSIAIRRERSSSAFLQPPPCLCYSQPSPGTQQTPCKLQVTKATKPKQPFCWICFLPFLPAPSASKCWGWHKGIKPEAQILPFSTDSQLPFEELLAAYCLFILHSFSIRLHQSMQLLDLYSDTSEDLTQALIFCTGSH